ncbi:HAD superfamily hydrolase [Desulfuromonas sp. DDH964]|uniref:pyrimidine 5'-nucleotidase n=1 Tax=Desulfuromonas sp. DDH964 TaxID=1823759 RepID=UPI00078CC4D6|nr:pyrimidine 5'-nucleotidase [Desulfuromonas sp. DDH964]AMV73795.1 HAD superfamily hydrolase [Desulfuromonas sp. DDH964]
MVAAVLFDLDNTLYAPERDLFALIDKRINRYMLEVVAIPRAEVDGLRRHYWKAYGATLQGLIRHYGVDPEDYLDYVHDVDVSTRLQPDPLLCSSLQRLPLRRFVFTNGSRGHAERVLAALGLAESFEEIFDIRIANYQPKPNPDPYHGVLRQLGLAAGHCVMVEDSLANLATAKQLGMTTVLVAQDPEQSAVVDHQVATASQAAQLVTSWL